MTGRQVLLNICLRLIRNKPTRNIGIENNFHSFEYFLIENEVTIDQIITVDIEYF